MGSSGVTIYNGNPGSNTVNVRWCGRFSHYTVDWSVNWIVSVNSSPADFPWIPISPHVDQRRIRKDFLCQRRHQSLWHQSNCVNPRVLGWSQDRDFSDGPATQSLLVQNSVASVCNCVCIARNIALCVTHGHFV